MFTGNGIATILGAHRRQLKQQWPPPTVFTIGGALQGELSHESSPPAHSANSLLEAESGRAGEVVGATVFAVPALDGPPLASQGESIA